MQRVQRNNQIAGPTVIFFHIFNYAIFIIFTLLNKCQGNTFISIFIQ